MNTLILQLRGTLWWRLEENSAEVFPFKHRPGWSVINPLLYENLNAVDGEARFSVYHGPRQDTSTVVVASNLFCMETPYTEFAEAEEFLFEQLPLLLHQLRFVSKNANCPRGWKVASIRQIDPADLGSPVFPMERKSGAIVGVDIRELLTTEVLEAFVELESEFRAPIHSVMLLDAIEAFQDSDFKKCLLYAAISAESGAASLLDNNYQTALADPEPSRTLRISDQATSSGTTRRLDPVFEALSATHSTGKMRRLLHELPLYLLGKSLLLEDDCLFNSLISLYKTRNEIAHLGGETIDHDFWAPNKRACLDALESVAKLFRWYGEPGEYPVPQQLLHLGPGEPNSKNGAKNTERA